MSWIALLILGGAGGALNAALTRPFRLLPSVRRLMPGKRPVLGLGLVGNVVIGSGAAAMTWWWPAGPACAQVASSEAGLLVASGGHVLIAFVAARWVTAERDRAILRRAVYKAAIAPAAHPDTVRAIEIASPDAIYDAVDELIPRRIER